MWKLVYILFIIISLVLLILQFVYFHTQYEYLKSKFLSRGVEGEEQETKLDVYSIKLDLNYSPSNSTVKSIKDLLNQYQTTLPYVYKYKTIPIQVVFDKIAILAMFPSSSAQLLKGDILNNKVKYIIINNVAFMALNHSGMNEILTDDMNHIFVTMVALPNHKPIEDVKENAQFRMLPIFGSFKRMIGTNFVVDLHSEVFPKQITTRQITCHIVAYGINM